jgi:hypothetical protein
MGLDLVESAGEGLDVGVGEVLGEVPLDSIPVVAAGLAQLFGARVSHNDQDRTPIVRRADASDEPSFLHSVNHMSEAALAVKDPFRELVHANALRRLIEMNEDVVPALRDSHRLLEFRIEQVL